MLTAGGYFWKDMGSSRPQHHLLKLLWLSLRLCSTVVEIKSNSAQLFCN